ncbi:interferon lambda-4-like [Eschrichtius robustus]|uniref:interferon lambda-4-like n=1 Tax=Eschrichtius robustus TaxID=9764 RepID=UPI0035C001E2
MGPSGAAAVAVGLWVLVTVGVAADPEVVEPPRRLLSHYRSLDPRALLAIKALRDRYLELVRPGSRRKSLRRPGRRPQTRTAGSPRCHEATVIFNLLRLLAWDLRLAAHSGPCL